jgi:hypothetical protein
MPAAANIQQAIDDIVVNLSFPNSVQPYNDWMTNVFTPAGFEALAVGDAKFWDAQIPDQRTVFDWVVPSLLIQRQINASGDSLLTRNLEIEVVLRTLLAVQVANIANRITQDQEDTVVAAYNAAFV